MATEPRIKREARRLYVEESKTPADIARLIGKTERTVQNWMARAREAGDPWDKARAAYMLGPGGPESITHMFVPLFFGLMNTTIQQVRDKPDMDVMEKITALTKLTDASVKASNALGRLNPTLNRASMVTEYLKLTAEFVAQKFPQHREAFLEVLRPLAEHLVGKLEG